MSKGRQENLSQGREASSMFNTDKAERDPILTGHSLEIETACHIRERGVHLNRAINALQLGVLHIYGGLYLAFQAIK